MGLAPPHMKRFYFGGLFGGFGDGIFDGSAGGRARGCGAEGLVRIRFGRLIAVAVFAGGLCAGEVRAAALRIVSYNIDCADQASDNNITGTTHSLPTVIQAIGLHHLGSNAQPADVIGLEELTSTTLANFVTQLNAIYGAGTYASDPTTDPTTGGGTDGLIYKTATVQVVSARALLTGTNVLLQSNGSYTGAHAPGGGTNGITRAPLVYRLRPVGYGSGCDFYMYVSHARSISDNASGDARYAEAQSVRSDAKYNLPAGAHILYSGDWNLFSGSGENAYKCLTGQVTSDGIDWSDTSAVWANTNPTQAYDPMSKTVPPTTVAWGNVSGDNAKHLYNDSTSSLTSRLDIQLVNAPMLGVYNGKGGVQLAPDAADPYDTSNFPAAQYPYAFETFGNNGTTPRSNAVTNAANHSLDDLAANVPNATTVYADLQLTGSGSTFTGSDHYPIVGDYNIVPPPTTLASQGFVTGGRFQVKISSLPGTIFGIQASTDLTHWSALTSGTTDASGSLILQDTGAGSYPKRFYRAYWPAP